MIGLEALLFLCSIFSTAYAQNSDNKTVHFIKENKFILGTIFFLTILVIAVYLDKRNGYKYITILRLKAGELILRLRNMRQKKTSNKKQKVQTQESIPTSKQMHSIFDSEKTFVEGPTSAHQTIVLEKNNEMVSNMQLEQDTPKVNLRQVFQQKSEHNNNKRSKSKIRNRVQIKKSQIQEQAAKDTLQFTDDNSNQPNQNE